MQGQHVHTGLVAFLFAGVSAVVFIQLVRLGSAKLLDYPATAGLGRVTGALVHFGGQ